MGDRKLWMPLYIGDYLSDTIGLTNAQHGAYLLSIMRYWKKGESLTDKEMSEACGRDKDRVTQFYVWEGHRWHHKRVDEELAKTERIMAARHDRALKGALGRWGPKP